MKRASSGWRELPQRIDTHSAHDTDEKRYYQIPDISSGNKIKCSNNRGYDENRSEIGLKGKKEKYQKSNQKERNKAFRKIREERSSFLDKKCEEKNQSNFCKLYGLKRRKSWNTEPSFGSIVFHSDKENEEEGKQ